MTIRSVEILVTDNLGQHIEGARIEAVPEAVGGVKKAAYDAARKVYFLDYIKPGFFHLSIDHDNYEPQSKRVQVHPRLTLVTFMLYRENDAYTFRGDTRVAYTPRPGLIGIIISPTERVQPGAGERVNALLTSLGLSPAPLPDALPEARGAAATPAPVPSAPVPVAIVVQRNEDSQFKYGEALKLLRGNQLIEAAGPIFNWSREFLSIFTHQLLVRFRPEVTRQQINQLLEDEGLAIVETMPFAPSLFLVSAHLSVGEDINQKARRLLSSNLVIYAEPSLGEIPARDGVTPNDFLWDGCWDRKLVCLEEAWDRLGKELGPEYVFGSPHVIMAVIDDGIKSAGQVPQHSDLKGEIADKVQKVYKLFDFEKMLPNNEFPRPSETGPESNHGVCCAGVGLAMANNSSTGKGLGEGVAGAAPGVRLMGIIYPNTEVRRLKMLQWIAGLPVSSSWSGFPCRIRPGADVLTCSIGFGEGAPISGAAQDLLDNITNHGRDGKGCVAIFSAGNHNEDIYTQRPYGWYERAFSCAASTLDLVDNEVRACYSGRGNVAWCVPSSSDDGLVHDPPSRYSTWTTAPIGFGNLPSFPDSRTKLARPASISDQCIFVSDVGGIRTNSFILIGEPGATGSESVVVIGAPNPATGAVPTEALRHNHLVDAPVIIGPNDHLNTFGVTSAATPLSAGICALALSANPDLTWVEVREILRKTAKKIDLDSTDSIAQWLDSAGCPAHQTGRPPVRSNGFGYGRLDAAAAVEEALKYDSPRDLMIRKNLDDTGDEDSFSLDSPDIWVRNDDPSVDLAATLARYDEAGPHDDPSRCKSRWVYARVTNRGAEEASLDAWVRFYLALSDSTDFQYPEAWEPINGIGNLTSTSWDLGAYFIGEVALPPIRPNRSLTVYMPWPVGLTPPEQTTADSGEAYILVDILPHEGPRKGEDISEINNVAVKAIFFAD
jgi:subtilisin family serine protease